VSKPTYTMNLQVAQLWAAELKNGSHQPTPRNGSLVSRDDDGNRCFCAIGVLYDIAIKHGQTSRQTGSWLRDVVSWTGVPYRPHMIWDRTNIYGEVSGQFERDGKTFPEIAEWLQEHVILPQLQKVNPDVLPVPVEVLEVVEEYQSNPLEIKQIVEV
jgi:hypothetical protein